MFAESCISGHPGDCSCVRLLFAYPRISLLPAQDLVVRLVRLSKLDRSCTLAARQDDEKPSTEPYRTVTDLQNSGGDLPVVDKFGAPTGFEPVLPS
jgi:hypothetical protein